MSNGNHWMNEVSSVRQLRDEMRLKAHLLRSDLRAELDHLETQWERFERDLAPVRAAVGTTAHEVGATTRDLFHTLRLGYSRIRDAVKHAG